MAHGPAWAMAHPRVSITGELYGIPCAQCSDLADAGGADLIAFTSTLNGSFSEKKNKKTELESRVLGRVEAKPPKVESSLHSSQIPPCIVNQNREGLRQDVET